MKVDLTKLSRQELLTLANDAEQEAKRKRNEDLVETRNHLMKYATERGLSIAELFGDFKKSKPAPVVKYRDPSNPENTWTGRGRKPGWLVEAESAGRSLSEFEI